MDDFRSVTECPKCGYGRMKHGILGVAMTETWRCHVTDKALQTEFPGVYDTMLIQCKCGYSWSEKTKDQSEVKDVG